MDDWVDAVVGVGIVGSVIVGVIGVVVAVPSAVHLCEKEVVVVDEGALGRRELVQGVEAGGGAGGGVAEITRGCLRGG